MKPQELRIGNLINGMKGIETVVDVLCDSVNTLEGGGLYDDYAPIELTEEWLFRLGFEIIHKNNKHYAINDPNGVRGGHKINIFPTMNFQWHIAFSDTNSQDYIPTTRIKYVHQLQNLIFALIGRELMINT